MRKLRTQRCRAIICRLYLHNLLVWGQNYTFLSIVFLLGSGFMKKYQGIYFFYIISTIIFILIRFSNYLLFHTMVELFTIIFGALIFVVSIYSRKYIQGSSFALLGIAYLFLGIFDFMHIFTFDGVGICDYSQNISNQFFIISRLLESIMLLLAFTVCFKKKLLHDNIIYIIFIVIFGTLFLVITESNLLPAFYTQIGGQTYYAVIIYYVTITFILAAFIAVYFREKRRHTKIIVLASLLLKLIATLFFSIGSDYEYAVTIGHLLRYTSYMAFYYIFVRETLRDPYATIFRTFRNKEMELLDLAQRDSLTGLYNHSTSFQKITDLIEQIGHTHENICIMMIDMDDFKMINDNHGHIKGDEVLKKVAKIFKYGDESLKLAGRYGGDEFLLVFSDFEKDLAIYTCHKILEKVSALKEVVGFEVSISIGCAIWEKGDTASDLVHKADLNMYQAKEKGKNTCLI